MTACGVCERPLPGGTAACRNPLCASASRWFRWNIATAERSGPLEEALDAYKYGGERRWVALFGQMLAEVLAGPRRLIDSFDVVVASPTFVGVGGRREDHVAPILAAAAARLPPDVRARLDLAAPPAIVKTGPTPRLAGRRHAERRRLVRERLRPVLRVTEARRTAGRRILVFDDVFTDGCTLDEVARALRLQGGAREVCGVALCRQPWRGGALCSETVG